MSSITIRHSNKEEYEAVSEVYAGFDTASNTLQTPFPSKDLWKSRLENIPQGSYSLIAEKAGEIIGQIGFETSKNPRRKHVASFGMGVKESFHGQGVGSKLLSSVLDLADNWLNIKRIELVVYTDNEPAINLYKKYGFVVEGESENYAFRNGKFVNAFHMARVLNT